MSEGIEKFENHSAAPGLESAAREFRTKVEDAANRLSGAAEQFVTMSEGLLSAVEEARQASERAQAAQNAVEEMRDRLARDYGQVSDLVRDLQERIAALATLGQPLPSSTPSEPQQLHPQEPQAVSSGYNSPGESSW